MKETTQPLQCPRPAPLCGLAVVALGLLSLAACSSNNHPLTGGTATVGTTSSTASSSGGSGTSGTASSTTSTAAGSSTTAGGSSSAGSTSSGTSSTGHHTNSSSSSGSTTGAPLCNDCRQADCPCGGSAPYCDMSTGVCKSCRGAAHPSDCPGAAAPACETDAGVCVACLAESNCNSPIRPHCGEDHSCVACTSDSQCAEGGLPHCGTDPTSPLYGQCWSCTQPGDCILGQICDPYRGQCQFDCRYHPNACGQSGFSCNQLTGKCSAGCNIDSDCTGALDSDGGSTPLCDPVYGNCVSCTNDSFCASGDHCQTNPLLLNYGACQACVGSGQGQCDSAHAWLCESNGHCEVDCRQDAGYPVCGWGQSGEMERYPVCDKSNGLCVQCAQSSDCALLGAIVGGPVPPLCNPNNGACVQCVTSADCSFERPGCVSASGCGQCQRDSDCPNGQVCHDAPGFPASLGGPQFCFCKDSASCGGGTCVLGGTGFNFNPHNLVANSYLGYTGQCYCDGDAGAACGEGLTCISVQGGLVDNANNPGHCCPPGSTWNQAAGYAGVGGACILSDGGVF